MSGVKNTSRQKLYFVILLIASFEVHIIRAKTLTSPSFYSSYSNVGSEGNWGESNWRESNWRESNWRESNWEESSASNHNIAKFFEAQGPGQRQSISLNRRADDAKKEPSQFVMADMKVLPEFLRTEYMIGYTFMGVMYGLGFLVLFQCILMPLVKGLTMALYLWLLYIGLIDPVTAQDALQQLPPQ